MLCLCSMPHAPNSKTNTAFDIIIDDELHHSGFYVGAEHHTTGVPSRTPMVCMPISLPQ